MTAPSIDLPAWMVAQLSQASPDLLRQMVQTFPEWLLERRRRAEAALVSVVATSYLLGVSTRRMEKLVETLGISRLSKCRCSSANGRVRGSGRRTKTRMVFCASTFRRELISESTPPT